MTNIEVDSDPKLPGACFACKWKTMAKSVRSASPEMQRTVKQHIQMIQLCQNYGEKKRLLWFSGKYGCFIFIQAEKEKYKWMCEKDLTSAGRKGKMLNVSLDHCNSVCISVNVKYTGPQTPRFFKNQLPAVRHKPKLLVPELYPHKHWWKSEDPCHLAAQRSAGILMGLRGMKFDWNYI